MRKLRKTVVATRITDVVRGPLICVMVSGELVLADVTVLRLRFELLFQNPEIRLLVSSVASASHVSFVVSASRVSSLVSAARVSEFSAGRASSVISAAREGRRCL